MDDFLIIGGGVAGTSAGARLAKLGQVRLLEAEDALAYHASGRSAALFEESYGTPAVVAMNHASRRYHEDAGYLTPRGLMVVGAKGQDAQLVDDLNKMKLDAISVDEARAFMPILNPDALCGAGYHSDALDIDTDRLVQGYAGDLRTNGAIVTGAKVTAITKKSNGWQVETAKGVFQGRHLVNAAGAWVDDVATMAGVVPIGIRPLRRSMARIPAPGGLDVSGWPMVLNAGETWYAKPDAGALIVSPADAELTTPHDAWADDMVLAEGLARYEEMVTEPVTRVISNWAGLRSFTPDGNLAIGPAADDPSFIWFAGQGGYGMQSSPAASQLLADIVGGTPSELDAKTVASLAAARFG
ncbi:Glycine/D-amino acid oxidase [Aliiroseovarius halocynthiae]|uniref:FAD-binding oxidoreductase n=1 Tax=Aliiroseovarius halocynthiae TaxID=985055 RepID=A0A545SRL0_9RHOB|nr:FAD-binding oxidoreductase [Aliiroseovarius halocynthiae]TQV67597.1 FAD-binding oxidoreductase [Aliiroseovarius halocynthiae]SMR81616.1 Glycine/D-amino acid oxidase [Aliiroseovarius halocynthiae]